MDQIFPGTWKFLKLVPFICATPFLEGFEYFKKSNTYYESMKNVYFYHR